MKRTFVGLGVFVVLLVVLARVPADLHSPNELFVKLDPATGEYCCMTGSRIVGASPDEWMDRPGFTEKRTYGDVVHRPGTRPCEDCRVAMCFVIPQSRLEAIMNFLWGYQVRPMYWSDWIPNSPNTRQGTHRDDGSGVVPNWPTFECVDDPDPWWHL